jgi:integral membrane sensor domain MASE1
MRPLTAHLLTLVAYLAAAQFAQALAPLPGEVAPVWPAAGVGLAALFLWGAGLCPRCWRRTWAPRCWRVCRRPWPWPWP